MMRCGSFTIWYAAGVSRCLVPSAIGGGRKKASLELFLDKWCGDASDESVPASTLGLALVLISLEMVSVENRCRGRVNSRKPGVEVLLRGKEVSY